MSSRKTQRELVTREGLRSTSQPMFDDLKQGLKQKIGAKADLDQKLDDHKADLDQKFDAHKAELGVHFRTIRLPDGVANPLR